MKFLRRPKRAIDYQALYREGYPDAVGELTAGRSAGTRQPARILIRRTGKRFICFHYAGAAADVTEAVERSAWLRRDKLQNSTSSSDMSSGSFMAAAIHSRM
jgi:hypothetical protein